VRTWLAQLDLPAAPRRIIDDCLGLIDQLTPIITQLERDLLARARPDPRVQALRELPGTGRITAMTLVAEIGDITRFPTARKLCAWAGLTPQVRNSDRTIRHGHITKQGSAAVRFVLEEAAERARPARPLWASTPSAPPAAATTSPPSPWPASCWPAASTSSPRSTTTSTTTPPIPRQRRSPRRVRSRFRMCLQHGRSTD
jgi:hypothetical protein